MSAPSHVIDRTSKPPPPWLFALTGMPYGVGGAFAGQVMPYLTRDSGIEVDAIGWYGTLMFVPPMLQFLYAPLVDIGPSRRHWLVIVSVLGALCYATACLVPLPDHISTFLVFAVAGQLISGLVGSCNGALLATSIPDELRGRASAFYNIGNLSGGAVAAGIIILLVDQGVAPIVVGLVLAVLMITPSFAVLMIVEPPREVGRDPARVFRTMLRDVGGVLFSRSGATGILLCLSPVGTAALVNYFSGLAEDFDATGLPAAIINGPANAILSAIGAVIGGYLCDRYNRRALYLSSGVLTATCALIMAVSPRNALTYELGVATYYLITGFCYSAFTATVLETIGKGGKAAATQYTLFTAAGNVAIAYVGLVDTRFHGSHAVSPAYSIGFWDIDPVIVGDARGLFVADATLNIAGVIVLAFVFWRLGSFGKWRHVPEPSPS